MYIYTANILPSFSITFIHICDNLSIPQRYHSAGLEAKNTRRQTLSTTSKESKILPLRRRWVMEPNRWWSNSGAGSGPPYTGWGRIQFTQAAPWFLFWWDRQCGPKHCHVAEKHDFDSTRLDNEPWEWPKRGPIVHSRMIRLRHHLKQAQSVISHWSCTEGTTWPSDRNDPV